VSSDRRAHKDPPGEVTGVGIRQAKDVPKLGSNPVAPTQKKQEALRLIGRRAFLPEFPQVFGIRGEFKLLRLGTGVIYRVWRNPRRNLLFQWFKRLDQLAVSLLSG
jgi:hypothetical protein